MKVGDSITYTQATPALANPDAPAQPLGLYTAEVVEVGEYSVFVRKEGWGSDSPLYVVSLADIVLTSLHQDEPSTGAMSLEAKAF